MYFESVPAAATKDEEEKILLKSGTEVSPVNSCIAALEVSSNKTDANRLVASCLQFSIECSKLSS